MNSKKAQFFVASLVVMGISVLIILTFTLTTVSTESINSESSSNLELLDIVNVVEEQNTILQEDWYDANWKYRQKISVSTIGCGPPDVSFSNSDIDPTFYGEINGKLETGSCYDEVVITKISDPFNKLTKYTFPPAAGFSCINLGVTCADHTAQDFYVYYGNANAAETASGFFVGTLLTITSAIEQTSILNCTQMELNHPGRSISCGLGAASGQTRDYNITFSSPDLQFEGTVS